MILDKVSYPKDLKNLSQEELVKLASEIRTVLITKLNKTGGHLAPNLGMVEATIALHYVFDCPKDKIVFDISHQSYVHKMLTGRKDGFTSEPNYKKYTSFTNPAESEYDVFKTGHSSVSISFATGLAKARDINGEKYNIITVIGDGALTGGQAYEGLNNAGTFKYEYNNICYEECPNNTKSTNNSYQCVYDYKNDTNKIYEYNDIYYEECPQNTKLIEEKKKCVDDCKEDDKFIFKYENACYEQCPNNYFFDNETKFCYDEIPEGFYCNDTQTKILYKCHEDCKECNGSPTSNNNNCLKCKDENKFINFGNSVDSCVNG